MDAESDTVDKLSRKKTNHDNPNDSKKMRIENEFCSCCAILAQDFFLHVSNESISKESTNQKCDTSEIDAQTEEAISKNGSREIRGCGACRNTCNCRRAQTERDEARNEK